MPFASSNGESCKAGQLPVSFGMVGPTRKLPVASFKGGVAAGLSKIDEGSSSLSEGMESDFDPLPPSFSNGVPVPRSRVTHNGVFFSALPSLSQTLPLQLERPELLFASWEFSLEALLLLSLIVNCFKVMSVFPAIRIRESVQVPVQDLSILKSVKLNRERSRIGNQLTS